MKKRLMRCLSSALCAVLLSVPALAAEPAAGEPGRQGPVRVWGTVTWLDNGGLLVENSNESDPLHEVVLHGESIICLDAVTGESMELEQIKDGDTIYAWVGPAMTMSLPPQVTAQMIVANIPADYGVPQYYEIASVTPQAMIAIYPPPALTWTEVTATDGTTLRITDEAELTPTGPRTSSGWRISSPAPVSWCGLTPRAAGASAGIPLCLPGVCERDGRGRGIRQWRCRGPEGQDP